MNSLAHTTPSATLAPPQRRRFVGWSAVASGLALLVVGEKPYFPAELSPLLLVATLALFLGMVPAVMWLAKSTAARVEGSATAARTAAFVGIAGMLIAVVAAILALPRWLPAVPAQILDTSSLGVIGLWLLAANALALRARLTNRVLAVLGALAGVGFFLSAATMWVELIAGNLGSAVTTLESVRLYGSYLGQALYLVWALWLGIWLLVRKR